MSRKWFDNKVPNNEKILSENKLENSAKIAVENYIYNFDNYKLDLAANEVLSLAINTNLYLNDNQPWLLIKEKDNLPLVREIIYNVLESTRIIGLLLNHFLDIDDVLFSKLPIVLAKSLLIMSTNLLS